jgi:hypothetical protein
MKAPVTSKPRGFSALLRSYAADVRGWATRLAVGYGIAAALLLGGVLAVFAAIAVGAIALFHFITLRYGTDIAFAALGGGLLLLGVLLLLAGLAMMKRRVAPLPRPKQQLRAARQMLIVPTLSRAVAALSRSDAARPDTTTQVLLGAAAIAAVGWIVATRLGSSAPPSQVRR